MNSRIKLSVGVLTIGAVLVILWFSGTLVAQLLRRTIELLTFLVSVLFLPAVLFVLAWFVYSVFLKKYLRARRIAKIRNARYMKEAVARGASLDHTKDPAKSLEEDSDPSLGSG